MELSGMALGPQVQLLELDRFGIFTGRAGDRPGNFSENTLGKSWMIDYIPGPEEPEQAPPSPDYVQGPEHADDEIVTEDQPYAEDALPIAQSLEYVPESDLEEHPEDDDDEDPKDDPVDYPVDGGDDCDDEEESSEDDEDD
nr:hypothetical protein [Tanacetum cinerariifolium]